MRFERSNRLDTALYKNIHLPFLPQHAVKCYQIPLQALAAVWKMCNYDQISLHVRQAIFKSL